jgi:Family of unknown function (DUF6644)
MKRALLLLALVSSGCAGRINDEVWRPFAEWSYATSIGTIIHESGWLFAAIESVHLLALAAMGGAILIVDLRLLGLGLGDEPLRDLARDAQRMLLAALAVMLATGGLLYLSEATKFYSEDFWGSAEFPFIYKMLFLALAMLFTFTVRRRALASSRPFARGVLPLIGLTSMLLWLGVAVGGRGIGFY